MSETVREIPTQVTNNVNPHTSPPQINFPDTYDTYTHIYCMYVFKSNSLFFPLLCWDWTKGLAHARKSSTTELYPQLKIKYIGYFLMELSNIQLVSTWEKVVYYDYIRASKYVLRKAHLVILFF